MSKNKHRKTKSIIVVASIIAVVSSLYSSYKISVLLNNESNNLIIVNGIATASLITVILVIFIGIMKPLRDLENMFKKRVESRENITYKIESRNKGGLKGLTYTINEFMAVINMMILDIDEVSTGLFNTSQEMMKHAEIVERITDEVVVSVNSVAEGAAMQAEEEANTLRLLEETNDLIDKGNVEILKTVENIRLSTNAAYSGNENMVGIKKFVEELANYFIAATEKMEKLGKRSSEVTAILETIKAIGDQTKLLTLNAGIEAARAGEAGNGFAVVASEIKSLSDRTQKALSTISEIVFMLQADTKDMKILMDDNSKAIIDQNKAIIDSINGFSLIVTQAEQNEEEVVALQNVINHIYDNSNQTLEVTKSTDILIQNSAAAAEEVSVAIKDQSLNLGELVGISRKLESISDKLTNEIDKFKVTEAELKKFGDLSALVNKHEIKVGLLNSMSGPIANAGGLDGYRGQIIAIDMINKRGGLLGKYKIVPVVADDKSKADVAIAECKNLFKEKVPVIAGVYASGIAVPVAEECERNKVIFWDHIAVSDAVLKGKHYQYVFRPAVMGSMCGSGGADIIINNYNKIGIKSLSELKAAIIYVAGPFGESIANGCENQLKKHNVNIAYKAPYDEDSKDLKPLVQKLIDSKVDVIFHVSYFDDMCVFLKDAEALSLKVKAMVGFGGGHGMLEDVDRRIGRNITKYLINYDNPVIQLIPKDSLKPNVYDENKEFLQRLEEKFHVKNATNYHAEGFAHMMILLNHVFKNALEKYGEVTPNTVADVCRVLEIDDVTHIGYGVKFAPKADEYSGQNVRAYNIGMQWDGARWEVVFPEKFKTKDITLPLPKDSVFSK